MPRLHWTWQVLPETAPYENNRKHANAREASREHRQCNRVSPRGVRGPPLPKRAGSAKGSDATKWKGEQDVNQPGEHSKTEQFLRLLANQMCSQRRRGAKLLRLLAIGGQEEKRPFAVFFFRAPPVILNAQLTTDAIEVPNTDVDVELFL